MSKYIRTEDKIIDVSYLNKDDKGNYYTWESDDFCANRKYIYKADVIKESDNLEDLCDEFIGIYKEQGLEPHFIETSLKGLIEETTKYCYDNTTLDDLNIYGAIWTYEGLKYVVKMNENNELELI